MAEQRSAAAARITPAEIIGRIAPAAIRSILVPEATLATAYAHTDAPMPWRVTSFEDAGGDTYRFVCVSPPALRADCTVRLDRHYRVAVHRATLTNTSEQRSRPMSEASALCLRLAGVTRPAVFSCSGAGSPGGWPHAREYPPDAFRPRWIWPISPRPVRFESGASHAHQLVSSTKDLPLFMIQPAFETDAAGLSIGIEWSTRWKADITFGDDRTGLRVAIGPTIRQMVLEPGERIDLPAVHVGFFEGPVSAGTNACRRYISGRITPHYRGKPVLPPVVHTLWGSRTDYRLDDVIRQVDAAAAIGVELFCVDQDWYPGGSKAGVGTWDVDRQRFPEGLEPVADYVRAKGMGMGLYFESAAYDDSRIVREHPEFFRQPAHASVSPKHYLFDFGNPDACDYWIDLISGYVERLDLRFIRADFGGYPMPADGALEWHDFDPDDTLQFAYVAGKFRVWETLLERHPKLMWELNAGGGNCIDLGSMRRHHCAWGSDMMSKHTARMMQLGAASFVPGNFMGEAIITGDLGPDPDDTDLSDISFLSRMAGSFYLCGAIDTWPERGRRRARHWVAVYKRVRHLLVRDFYRLLPQPQSDQDWDAAQFCDGDREGMLLAYRYRGRAAKQLLPLQAVDEAATYLITDEATGQRQTVGGGTLRDEGLIVTLELDSAKLFTYESVGFAARAARPTDS